MGLITVKYNITHISRAEKEQVMACVMLSVLKVWKKIQPMVRGNEVLNRVVPHKVLNRVRTDYKSWAWIVQSV